MAIILVACATDRQPGTTTDLCEIFEQRSHWYRAMLESEEDWDTPIPVQMAILWRESAFDPDARPARDYVFFGLIPWGRISTSEGFTQAVDATWQWYRDSTGNSGASRSDFADSADFVGWYTTKSNQINGIRKSDAYNQYLAYHEGHGNYRKRTYRKKPGVRHAAREVADMADRYARQLRECRSRLRTRRFLLF